MKAKKISKMQRRLIHLRNGGNLYICPVCLIEIDIIDSYCRRCGGKIVK